MLSPNMAPDIEELIKKVNTLTLDKNRLKQKLTQLTNQGGGANNISRDGGVIAGSNHSPLSLTSSQSSHQLQQDQSSGEIGVLNGKNISSKSSISSSNKLSDDFSSPTTGPNNKSGPPANVIAGVECSTSCEEDLLFMNDLYKKRLEEYTDNWDYIQSKCTALLSEMNALQKHYALVKKEKLDLEDRYKTKCDDYDKIKSELQTVVLNYESQLSAMSEHLSMITSQVSLGDDLGRVQSN